MSSNEQKLPYLDVHGRLTKQAEEALALPFAAEEIKWKPQQVKKNKATVIAYADSRVYHERLDEVFGPGNWSSDLRMDSAPYRQEKKDWDTKEITVKEGHKIFMIASLTVNGLGTKTSSGDCETDNDNAVTVAEAQAFKRACSMLGIGRYLYFLPKYEGFEIEYGKLKSFPTLPPWALPPVTCEDCKKAVTDFTYKNAQGEPVVMPKANVLQLSQEHFQSNLCGACVAERRTARKKANQSAEAGKKEQVA